VTPPLGWAVFRAGAAPLPPPRLELISPKQISGRAQDPDAPQARMARLRSTATGAIRIAAAFGCASVFPFEASAHPVPSRRQLP
jgi:hypothetical protein